MAQIERWVVHGETVAHEEKVFSWFELHSEWGTKGKARVPDLDRCLDHGLDGFRRYVALAMVGRNIQQLRVSLRRCEAFARQRQPGYLQAA